MRLGGRPIEELSRSERARGIACVPQAPPFIVMDEPMASLDLGNRLLVLADGRLAAHGPAKILTSDTLSAIYRVSISVEHTPGGQAVIVPIRR